MEEANKRKPENQSPEKRVKKRDPEKLKAIKALNAARAAGEARPNKLTAANEKLRNATLAEKIQVLDWHHANGRNQGKTAAHFNEREHEFWGVPMDQPKVSSWLKQEQTLRDTFNSDSRAGKMRSAREVKCPKLEEALAAWVQSLLDAGRAANGDAIKAKAEFFRTKLGFSAAEAPTFSAGWLDGFKARHNLKNYAQHGEAGSAPVELLPDERKRVLRISAEYGPARTYNADEAGLQTMALPKRGLTDGRQMPGTKENKFRLTYMFAVNQDGTDKRPPFVIGYAWKPAPFGKKTGYEHGFHYVNNAKAWMTAAFFATWLQSWDQELRQKKKETILLWLDNFSGHVVPDGLTHIRCEFFVANLTSHIQPLDQGIIRAWKAIYRRQYIARAINLFDAGNSASMYHINQLQAMRLADKAWKEVKASTIINCWIHAGISELTNEDADGEEVDEDGQVIEEEQALAAELVELAEVQNLPTKAFVTAAELVDIPKENHFVLEDDDIVALYSKNGVTDEQQHPDNDPGYVAKEPPKRQEVLDACKVISAYMNTSDEAYREQLEGLIGRLGRELRLVESKSLKPTTLDNFFTKKVPASSTTSGESLEPAITL